MASIAELFVRIGADVRQFEQSMTAAGAKVDTLLKQVNLASGDLRQAGFIMQAAGAAIIGVLGLSAAAASEAAVSQEELRAAVERSGKAFDVDRINAMAASLQNLTRYGDEAVRSVARILIQFGATQQQVERLTPVILDVSRALGRDLGATAAAFARGMGGAEGALSRFIGQLPEGVSLSENFEEALAQLEGRFGGFAVQMGRTLPDAIIRLKNQIGEIAEVLGAPLLGPLQTATDTLVRMAQAAVALGERFPAVVTAIAGLGAAVGGLLLGAGGVLVFTSGLAGMAKMLTASVMGVSILKGAIIGLGAAIRANPVGLLITAALTAIILLAPAIMAKMDHIRANVARVFAFIGTAARELAVGMKEVAAGMATLDFSRAAAGAERVRDAFKTASKEGAEAYWQSMEEAAKAQAKAADGAGEVALTVGGVGKAFEAAARAAELYSLGMQRAAAEQATAQLQQPGLNEAQLRVIEEQRLRRVQRAVEDELHMKVTAAERLVTQLQQIGKEGDEKRAEAEKNLTTLYGQLAVLRHESARKAAEEIVAAEKAAAEERVRTEQRVRDEQAKAAAASMGLRVQEADHAAAMARVQEETRVGMLRRTVGIQRELGAGILGAQQALAAVQASREEAALRERNARRLTLVNEGLMTEAEAQRLASEEQLRIRAEAAARQLELERQRLAMMQQLRQAEAALSVAEAGARLESIEAEAAARRAQVETNQQLRMLDLANAEAKARAEAQATIASIQTQIEARAAAGQMTPAELTAARARMDAIVAQFTATQDRMKVEAEATARMTNMALEAVDKETAAKRLSVQKELQVNLARLASEDVQERAQAASRIVALEGQLADEIAAERERLAKAGFSESEIRAMTRGAEAILASVSRVATAETGKVESALTLMQTAYERFASAVSAALKPVLDAVKLLSDPKALENLMQAARNLRPPAMATPGAPALAPAAAAVMAAPTININGAQIHLTADESAILSRLVAFLLGPEGNALVTRWFRNQPGPRR